ncbi:hypothetical protein ACFW04_002415 [Cataglyphis niger]
MLEFKNRAKKERKKERNKERGAFRASTRIDTQCALTRRGDIDDLDEAIVGGRTTRYKSFCFLIRKADPSCSYLAPSSSLKPYNMFKLCILAVLLAAVSAAPAPAPGAILAAPAAYAAVPAPIVTASSSQVIARNYNTLAGAPLAAAPIAAYGTHAVGPLAAAPLAYAAAPLAAYGTHAVAPAYTAYSAPLIL